MYQPLPSAHRYVVVHSCAYSQRLIDIESAAGHCRTGGSASLSKQTSEDWRACNQLATFVEILSPQKMTKYKRHKRIPVYPLLLNLISIIIVSSIIAVTHLIGLVCNCILNNSVVSCQEIQLTYFLFLYLHALEPCFNACQWI